MSGTWGFTAPSGRVVRIGDLPVGVVSDIAASAGVGFGFVVGGAPGAWPGAVWSGLYEACCAAAGETPAKLTAQQLFDQLDLSDVDETDGEPVDDLPTSFDESGLPLEEAGTPTTTG